MSADSGIQIRFKSFGARSNLRIIPKTEALLEQKLRSLDAVSSWWFERLADGTTTRRSGVWRRQIPVDTLFDDYVHNAEKVGVRRKSEKTALGMKLHKLVPGLTKKKLTISVNLEDGTNTLRRVQCLLLPSLKECREAFQTAVGQAVDWGDPDEGDEEASRENSESDGLGEGAPEF